MFNLLRLVYSFPERKYHTYSHACNVALTGYELSKIECPDAAYKVYLAGMYHDAIYVPGRQDNEDRSAEFFLTLDPLLTDVADMIRATTVRDHLDVGKNNSVALNCLLDADLSSLAADWDAFLQNQRNILWEAELDDLTKSADFLSLFLGKTSIYRTETAKSRYEQKARQNIQKLIQFVYA